MAMTSMPKSAIKKSSIAAVAIKPAAIEPVELKYSAPYTGNRIPYNRQHQKFALMKRKFHGVPKGVKMTAFMRDFKPETDDFLPVPDRGYDAYAATFTKADLQFLCDQCNGRDAPLAVNIQAGLVCENYVNALLDVVKVRMQAHREGKMEAPEVELPEVPVEEAPAKETRCVHFSLPEKEEEAEMEAEMEEATE